MTIQKLPPSDDTSTAPPAGSGESGGATALAGVPEPLRAAMLARGFETLTPVQQAVLEQASECCDLRISSQTGSGKTVALGIAVAEDLFERAASRRAGQAQDGPVALVIAPTRELAAQVAEELGWLLAGVEGLRVLSVTGGADPLRERRALLRGADVVVGTPGRMLDHLNRGALKTDHVRDVVLDEADQMFDLGFREELEAIVDALPAERRSHLVSATFPRPVLGLADRFQSDPVRIEGTRPGDAHEDIEHVVHVMRPGDTYKALVNVLLATMGERCLVFVKRRVDAAELAEKLASDGFAALPLSGDLPQAQRTRTLDAFRNGSVPVLVATDVAARGIDVPDIARVVHADLPGNPEAYTHRSGRTGRAGSKGHSVLLVPPHAQQAVRRLLSLANVDARWRPAPSPAQVKAAVAKQARRWLHARLVEEPAHDPKQLERAARLLAEHDPAQLVATLLQLAEPPLCTEPVEVAEPAPEPRRRTPLRDRESGRAPRSGPRARRADDRRPPSPGFVRFVITWGERRGATPQRVLAHVCRRGNIKGRNVGSIRIGQQSTTVEISRDVAGAFEKRAARKDPREPKLRITRQRDDEPSGQARTA